MVAWGPIIGAGISAGGQILGGLLGKKKKGLGPEGQSNQAMRNLYRSFHYTVEGAKAAGIHPLVALGAASGGGFASPVGSSGFGWSDAVGMGLDALGRGVSDYFAQDADDMERARLEREIKAARDEERFDKILADQAQIGRDMLNEELVRAQINEARSRTYLNAKSAEAIGGPQVMGTNAGTLTDAFGDQLQPRNTGAQEYADQYGDILSEIYGFTNWLKDNFGVIDKSNQAPSGTRVPRSWGPAGPIY